MFDRSTYAEIDISPNWLPTVSWIIFNNQWVNINVNIIKTENYCQLDDA